MKLQQVRRIIQVTVAQETDIHYPTVVALCDDGTIWATEIWREKWVQVETQSITHREVFDGD
jgi:hypothetical protein